MNQREGAETKANGFNGRDTGGRKSVRMPAGAGRAGPGRPTLSRVTSDVKAACAGPLMQTGWSEYLFNLGSPLGAQGPP